MEEELLSKLKSIDFGKAEKKAVKAIVGFLFGFFFISMASKFVNDNFDFRIAKISNKPKASNPNTNS